VVRHKGVGIAPRLMSVLVAVVGLLVAGLLMAAPASATVNNPHVTLSGHISCGGISVPTGATYRTDAGESGSARITFTGTKLTKLPPLRELKWLKIHTYVISLNKVPSGGTSIHMVVTCSTGVLGKNHFNADFPVKRPLIGSSATVHVCSKDSTFPCVI
jgi:hypothetical protein